jgi:hypothetical protein
MRIREGDYPFKLPGSDSQLKSIRILIKKVHQSQL